MDFYIFFFYSSSSIATSVASVQVKPSKYISMYVGNLQFFPGKTILKQK